MAGSSNHQQYDSIISSSSQNSTSPNNHNGIEIMSPTEQDALLSKQDEIATTTDSAETADDDEDHGILQTIQEGVEYVVDNVVDMVDNAQEAAVAVAETVQEAAEEVRDFVVEEYQEVKDTFIEELKEADEQGESFFMEMTLTRGLSLLPEKLHEAADEFAHAVEDATGYHMDVPAEGPAVAVAEPEEGVPIVAKKPEPIPMSAYFTLAGAVVALASIGPSLDMQRGVDPSLKIYWRMTGTYMTLLPFAVRSLVLDGRPHLSAAQWLNFVLASVCYAIMCVAFVIALDFTSVGNAVIFSNSQALLLLLGKALVGAPVLYFEGSGAMVAFLGAILCSRDSSSASIAAKASWALWGDLLSLLSAIGGVFYLTFAKTIRDSMDVFVFMFGIMFCGSFVALSSAVLMGKQVSLSRDVNHGLWGWMNAQGDRFPLEMYMVIVCNLLGAMGYVRAMAYFDNLVISVACLLEPVVASFQAYFLQVGLLPGPMGWIGNVLVMAGTIAVIYPAAKKNNGGGALH